MITQEGGTRFLVFTRTGETVIPARVLDPQQFTKADKRTLSEIALPKADKEYRVVSHHDLAYAEAATMNKGKFKGTLRVTSPQQFWASSKYLIMSRTRRRATGYRLRITGEGPGDRALSFSGPHAIS